MNLMQEEMLNKLKIIEKEKLKLETQKNVKIEYNLNDD